MLESVLAGKAHIGFVYSMQAGLYIHQEIIWVPHGLPLIENICCCRCNFSIGTSTTRLSERQVVHGLLDLPLHLSILV